MNRSHFLLLLLSSILFLSFTLGFGRVAMMETDGDEDSSKQLMDGDRKMSEVYDEIMDYSEPEPNTNPKNGYNLSPPPAAIVSPPPQA
ncbi:unnamed protein product [Lathyrus sativus]|nr:unnamed protein product [Lathyrus sativus]